MLMAFLTASLLLTGFASVAAAKGLIVQPADVSELQGKKFTVTGYGCNTAGETASLAILQQEGTPYTFSLVSRPTSFWDTPTLSNEYQTLTDVPAGEALAAAEDIVKCSPEVQDVYFNRISTPEGTVLGYEMKPIYMPVRFGSIDRNMISTDYRIDGNQVIGSVKPDALATKNDWGGGA